MRGLVGLLQPIFDAFRRGSGAQADPAKAAALEAALPDMRVLWVGHSAGTDDFLLEVRK